MISVWFDGQLNPRKGDLVKILRGIPEGDRIRATVIENMTSGDRYVSRIEGVLMTNSPRDLAPPVEGYVRKTLHDANTTHLELDVETRPESEYAHDIFISYDSNQKEVAVFLDESCRAWDLKSFLAPRSISPGEDFVKRLKEGIDSSFFVTPILTREATSSQWVNQEIGYAAKLGKDEREEIIPIRTEGVRLEGFIRNVHAISYVDSWETTFSKFFDFMRMKMKDRTRMLKIGTECLACSQPLDSPIPDEDILRKYRQDSKPLEIPCSHCGKTSSLSPLTLLSVSGAPPRPYVTPVGRDVSQEARLLHSNELKQTLYDWKAQIPYPIASPECSGNLMPVKRYNVIPRMIDCGKNLEVEERAIFPDIRNHAVDPSLFENWADFKKAFGHFESFKMKMFRTVEEKVISHFSLPIEERWQADSLSEHVPNFAYNLIMEVVQRGEESARSILDWSRKVEFKEDRLEFWVGSSGMIKVSCNENDRAEVEESVWGKWDDFLTSLLADSESRESMKEILRDLQKIEDSKKIIERQIEELVLHPVLPGKCRYLES